MPRTSPVAAVAFVMFVVTLASNLPSPLYVLYQHAFGFSAATLTYVFAAYAIAVLVALLAVGRISDHVGRRPVMLPALGLLTVSALLFAAAQGTGWLLAARAVQGLATGTLTSAATAALVELEPRRDRRRASYLNTSAFISGAAFGPLLGGVLISYAPWPRVLPFLVELALLAVGLVLLAGVPETVAREPGYRWRPQRPSVPRGLRFAFAAAATTLAVSWSVGGLYGSLSASIDRDLLHVSSHALAGVVLFVFSALGGLAQIGLRRWPSRRTMSLGTVALAAGVGLVGASLSGHSVALFLLGTFAAGVGGGLTFMGSLSLVNDVAPPHQRAEMVSAYNVVGYLALSAPVVGVGRLATGLGLQRATQIFAGAIVAVAAVALVLTRAVGEPEPAETDELIALALDPATPASGLG